MPDHSRAHATWQDSGPAIEAWKRIAEALGRSERWCRYMARRAEDPLPVFMLGGITRMNVSDLEAWLARQRDRALPSSIAAQPAPASSTAPLAGDDDPRAEAERLRNENAQLHDENARLRAELAFANEGRW